MRRPLFLLPLLVACSEDPLTVGPAVALSADPARMDDRVDFEANRPALSQQVDVLVENHTDEDLTLAGASLVPAPDEAFGARVTAPDDYDGQVPAGGSLTLSVVLNPDEPGTWEGELVVQAGELQASVAARLVAQAGVDEDGDGWSPAMGDCDDAEALANPGTLEDDATACDGVDNDCDGLADDPWDLDGDGFLSALYCPEGVGSDCDDTDAAEFPGNTEVCDLRDNDCNGVVNDIVVLADNQTGVCEGAMKACAASGIAVAPDDYSSMEGWEPDEVSCDGLDNDCDGDVDGFDHDKLGGLDCVDDDGDGYAEVDGDCDDDDAAKLPDDCRGTLIATSLQAGFDDQEKVLPAGFVTIDTRTGVRKEHPWNVHGEGFYAGASVPGHLVFVNRGEAHVVAWTSLQPDAYTETDWDGTPRSIALGADGTRHVLAADGTLTSFGGSADRSLGLELRSTAIATAVSMDEGAGLLWACDSLGDVHRIDLADDGVTRTETGFTCYRPPVVDPARDQVIVTAQEGYTLVSLDRSTGEVQRTAPAVATSTGTGQAYPVVGDLSVHGLWVAHGVDGGVSLYDADTLEHIKSFEAGSNTQAVQFDADRGLVWLADYDSNQVLGLDWVTGATEEEVWVANPTDLFFLEE